MHHVRGTDGPRATRLPAAEWPLQARTGSHRRRGRCLKDGRVHHSRELLIDKQSSYAIRFSALVDNPPEAWYGTDALFVRQHCHFLGSGPRTYGAPGREPRALGRPPHRRKPRTEWTSSWVGLPKVGGHFDVR